MDLNLRIPLAITLAIFLCQLVSSDGTLDGSSPQTWTCVCSAGPVGALGHFTASNCSTSCECTPGGVGGWNCLCASDAISRAPDTINDTSCFNACNCTSGPPQTPISTKKYISNNGVVVILVLCVVLTTVVLLVSVACYLRHKDRRHVKIPIFSSEKDSSWNSADKLLSHRSASFPKCMIKSNTPVNPITDFLRRLFYIHANEKATLPGAMIQFSYAELEQATDKFSNANLIGLGGNSNVYRGQLKDGIIVAIKKLKPHGESDVESSFLTEIELISRLNHCHVVPLFGYCSEFQGRKYENLLVFEYMSNGNLRDCLNATQGKEPLDWVTRVGIALGAARGLEYLHESAAPRILHRDIKSTNILLDNNHKAKITDLGMAKHLNADDTSSCSSSPARMLGTFGYFAPEYAIVGKASLKSDVFSFGVVILELITGRQPIQRSSDKGDESLVIWATPRLRDSKLVVSELPDPLLKGNFPEEEMQIMAHLARECLQWDPDLRPTMSEVVQVFLTITHDKSKRRNLSAPFSTNSSHSITSISEIERQETSVDIPDFIRNVVSERLHARYSLPLAVDRNLCDNQQRNSDIVISAEYMQRLTLMTSNIHSCRMPDDEMLDLTEPRFESFVQANTGRA